MDMGGGPGERVSNEIKKMETKFKFGKLQKQYSLMSCDVAGPRRVVSREHAAVV